MVFCFSSLSLFFSGLVARVVIVISHQVQHGRIIMTTTTAKRYRQKRRRMRKEKMWSG